MLFSFRKILNIPLIQLTPHLISTKSLKPNHIIIITRFPFSFCKSKTKPDGFPFHPENKNKKKDGIIINWLPISFSSQTISHFDEILQAQPYYYNAVPSSFCKTKPDGIIVNRLPVSFRTTNQDHQAKQYLISTKFLKQSRGFPFSSVKQRQTVLLSRGFPFHFVIQDFKLNPIKPIDILF